MGIHMLSDGIWAAVMLIAGFAYVECMTGIVIGLAYLDCMVSMAGMTLV